MSKRLATGTLRRLSARQIQTAGEGDHADGGNLILRVRENRCSWVFRYTAGDARRREKGLGVCHRNSVSDAGRSAIDARAMAERARTLLSAGSDPIEHDREAARKRREALVVHKASADREHLTLCRVARAYHERVIEPARSVKHGYEWLRSLENHLGATDLWHKPIADIDGPELLDIVTKLQARVPETARRIRQRVELIFDDAEFRKLCVGNPALAIRNKLRQVRNGRRRGSFAALDYSELPAFVRDLRGQAGIAALALEFGILTTARTGEIIGCTWAEIDVRTATWRVPAARMKGGEAHDVFLCDQAFKILERVRGLDERFVFPSRRLNGGALSNLAMLSLLRRMKVQRLTTVHGLCRASFSTWANETGAGRPDVIEACLAHGEEDKVRAAYNRARFNQERRGLLEVWAAFIEGREPLDNPVSLRAV